MSRAVKIFGDAAQGSLFFEGSQHAPAPLGGVVVASAREGSTDRIKITRSDLFQKNGVDPRILFKRMRITRVRNKADQRLVGDLGFTQQEVIDYINDEANRKANEVDFQKNGSVVGSGNTLNFTGGIENVTVSNDVATIAINQVGIASTSGYVGTGVTLFHFRGSGVSTVTSIVGGATTIFFEGGGSSGNPVTSGAVTGTGNTTLRLTLQDASNVDIDVTSLRTTTAIGSSTNYFFLNNGAQLSSNDHDIDGGVTFYNQKLRRGEEIIFSTPGNGNHIGIWNGGNGITGSNNVRNKSNWSTKWHYNHSSTLWEAGNGQFNSTGVELNRDVTANNGTYAIRFDYNTEKLQLWQISTSFDWLISSAAVGVGSTNTFIFFSRGDGGNGTLLPSVSEIRASEWTLQSFVNTQAGPTIHTGVQDDDIWKSTRSMRPGMKMKTTLSGDTKIHHWGVGYGGTVGLGNGPLNPYTNATGSWRSSNSVELRAEENASFNNNYTAAVDASTNSTLDLTGRNISWRYNSNNSWDLFDEDTDEVILTGDTPLDGNDMYPYLFGASTINTYATELPQWEWEWNQATWFMEYRDWSSGHNFDTALSKRNNMMPLKTASEVLSSSSGHKTMTETYHKITWGEKLRPGQELAWTQLSINNNGSTKHNMIVGVLNSDFDGYTHGFRFYRTGEFKEQAQQDAGITVQAGITTTTAGQSCRIRYDAGDNKLKLDVVRSGVRETLGVSNSALDGNPVFISMGGDSTRVPTSTTAVQYYGWETVHEGVGHYNPWGNWRIGGFPENEGLGVGVTAGVLAYKADQVWRHKDGIPQGRKMHWLLPTTQANTQIGQWSSSNASSGLTNVENNDSFFDWSWQTNTSEEIDALKGWTFNTGNSNYSSTKWTDPNPGSTKFSIRYHSNNKVDIFDESNSEIIATKDVDADGNPIFISWVAGGSTSNQAQMQDDFFGGGDVGIALTTATV